MLITVTGLVTGMDYAVGELVEQLEENDLMDNTYIIFMSDVSLIW